MDPITSKKITRTNRDTFAKLGHQLPHPSALTAAEVKENIEYFRHEMRRLGRSVSWINDKIPGLHIESYCDPVIGAIEQVISDKTAQLLTTILDAMLAELDDLACRTVQTKFEGNDISDQLLIASYHAAKALHPICASNLDATMLCEQVIKNSMEGLLITTDAAHGGELWKERQALLDNKEQYVRAVSEADTSLKEYYKRDRESSDKKEAEK